MDFVHVQSENIGTKYSNKPKITDIFENILYMVDQRTLMINKEMIKLKEDVNLMIKSCKIVYIYSNY
jgi:hypothetical protein